MALLKHAVGIKLIFFPRSCCGLLASCFDCLSPDSTPNHPGQKQHLSSSEQANCNRLQELRGALSAGGWPLDTACPYVSGLLARSTVMARLPCALEVGGLFWRWAAHRDPRDRRVSLKCLAGLASETLMPEPAVVELCFLPVSIFCLRVDGLAR